MDYKYITQEAGPIAARIIKAAESPDYIPTDPETLDDLTRGALVLGVELIDAPFPDGIIFYLKLPTGKILALVVEVEVDDTGLYELITTSTATIQEADH